MSAIFSYSLKPASSTGSWNSRDIMTPRARYGIWQSKIGDPRIADTISMHGVASVL